MITPSFERTYSKPLCIFQERDQTPPGTVKNWSPRVQTCCLVSQDYVKPDLGEAKLGTGLFDLLSFVSRWFSHSTQVVSSPRTDTLPLSLSNQGSSLSLATDLIKQFEGLSLSAYQDSGNVWTIGYGSTQGVSPEMEISQEQAELLLSSEVKRVSEGVLKLVKVPLASYEHAALISFAYNVGLGNFKNSTLLRLLNDKRKTEAAEEFLRWVYCDNEKLGGLMRRRDAEYRLFLGK